MKKIRGYKENSAETKLLYSFRVKLVLFTATAYLFMLYSIFVSDSLFLMRFSFIIALCFLLLLGFTYISYKRKVLMLQIQQLIFSCENDNNLNDLIKHYDSALKKLKYAKLLSPFGKNKKMLKTYSSVLSNQKQSYIKNAVRKHYEIIVQHIKSKKKHDSRDINIGCKYLINTINFYKNIFDEKNISFSSSLFEKLYLIIDFTEKYIGAYNVNTQYNIDLMKGQEFERYCANLLIAYGFKNIEVTKGSGDQGVDIVGYYNGFKFAVQCKRYSKKVGNSPIQEVVAGKIFYNCQGALVITNNYYTESAIQLAKANNVQLWDRKNLMEVIYYTDNQWDELLETIKIGEDNA